ncbi:hypothetical protein B9Z07_28235 [Burkholderia cenocepacia]|uniref:Uncharacterized protein n=1 Tax=Burkholderia cenocepacia TaxID=95486 RepID=A0AAD0J8F7_9BURK|nr:hypothetical protein B9Z07_28235 [Burkholderia cenocepacia]PRE33732.1 hypothetical protein C6P63_26495 [Burkholderia cenocepacia]
MYAIKKKPGFLQTATDRDQRIDLIVTQGRLLEQRGNTRQQVSHRLCKYPKLRVVGQREPIVARRRIRRELQRADEFMDRLFAFDSDQSQRAGMRKRCYAPIVSTQLRFPS